MKNKRFNILINIFIIFVVLCLVLYFSLKDDYYEIVNAIMNMKVIFIFISILCLCLCRILIGITHYTIIKMNGENVSLWRCIQINFIILFFHGITPFAGGGQPMEVYYLHNEKIPITKATNITLQNFIVYQISFVLMGVFALVYNSFFHLFSNDHLIRHLVILGFIINILVLVITFFLSFAKKVNKFIVRKIIEFGYNLKIVKNKELMLDRLNKYLDSFYSNAKELGKCKLKLVGMIGINFVAIMILYSMPLFIALGLGINLNFLEVIVTTTYTMTIGSFVPIPGGTGGIEYGFVYFYNFLIRGSVVNAIMLMWRFVSYYLGMILGALALSMYRKRDKI